MQMGSNGDDDANENKFRMPATACCSPRLANAGAFSPCCLTSSAQTADALNPGANAAIAAFAIQPDGKILVGGFFSTLGGVSHEDIARLNADGTVDSGFGVSANSTVQALALQPDGRILVSGTFFTLNSQTRQCVGRFNANGSLDTSFSISASNTVYSLLVQSDGKILVGGNFKGIDNVPYNYLARVNPDGSLDTSFNPAPSSAVNSLALQSDGRKFWWGGAFSSVGAKSCNHIGRLNPDGSLDSSFNPGASSSVKCVVVQPDGKILLAGDFTTLAGQACNFIGRLNPDGSLDANFNSGANASINSLALQADGKIVVGGAFTTLSGPACSRVGRLNPDGSLDTSFTSSASGSVTAVALQPDGKILVGGSFTTLSGQARADIGRLNNNETANQALSFDASNIYWLRGGASPEIFSANFDVLSNGTNWNNLGAGARIAGGWQLSGQVLTSNATIRARGVYSGGEYEGSSSLIEGYAGYPTITNQPSSLTNNAGTQVSFNVAAIGSPLGYQWYKGAAKLADGGNISGSQTATLNLAAAFGGDAGLYSVVVSNAYGSITSTVVSLVVIDPVITNQPLSQLVNIPQPFALNVGAVGTSLAYQWQQNGMNLAGATGTSYTVTNSQASDTGNYTLVVSNTFGVITSAVAYVEVNLAVPDTNFNAMASGGGSFQAMAFMPNGQILIGGGFGTLGGASLNNIARLNVDGTADNTFNPGANNTVWALCLEPDYRVLAAGQFTTLGGGTTQYLGRLTATGTNDTSIALSALNYVECILAQPDGSTLLGGSIIQIGSLTNYFDGLARLDASGSPDVTFGAEAGSFVNSMAVQANNQVIIGGNFLSGLDNLTISNLGRFNADGSADASFTPTAANSVYALVVQPDGKILVGGSFSTFCGKPQGFLGRLNPDGTMDTNFNPVIGGNVVSSGIPNFDYPYVSSIALQVDGKIVLAGRFTNLCGQGCYCLGRLNPDGSVDSTFNPPAAGLDAAVGAVGLQPDGKLLVGGQFSSLGGRAVYDLCRLNNTGPATQSLALNGSIITWLRGGTSPEVYGTAFDYSTDGTNWVRLGMGTRFGGGWQLTGVSVPIPATLRAHGWVSGGYQNASSWFVEQTIPVQSQPPPKILATDGAFGWRSNQFGFNVSASAGQAIVIEASTDLVNWVPLSTNTLTGNTYYFSDSSTAGLTRRFYRARVP